MTTSFVLAAMLAASLAGVPAVNADTGCEPTYPLPDQQCGLAADCGLETAVQERTAGDSSGRLYGYVVTTRPGATVSIRCYLRVDWVEVASTPAATGTNVATTTEWVAYSPPSDAQNLDICTEWTRGAESGTTCFEISSTQIPPQEVIDLLDQIFDLFAETGPLYDPVCDVLPLLQGQDVPGIVEIGEHGDISVAGELLWDCPPFGS